MSYQSRLKTSLKNASNLTRARKCPTYLHFKSSGNGCSQSLSGSASLSGFETFMQKIVWKRSSSSSSQTNRNQSKRFQSKNEIWEKEKEEEMLDLLQNQKHFLKVWCTLQSQFYQHFVSSFFIWNCYAQLFCYENLCWYFFFVEIKLLKLTIDINFTNLHNNNMFRNCMVVKLNGIFFPQVSNARAFEHNAIWLVKCCQIVLKLLPCANSKK